MKNPILREKIINNNFTHKIFNVRLQSDYHYFKLVSNWWVEHNWPIPPLERLSTLGVMVERDEQPICAGWLYQTDSLMAVIGFIVANQQVGKIKKEALKYLVSILEEKARNMGFNVIFMPMESSGMARIAIKEMGYIGNKTNELIKNF